MPESTNARRARLASYVPLKITARLRSGVVSDGLLMLDGALYAAQHRERLAPKVASLPRASAMDGDGVPVHLPIRRIPIAKMPNRFTPDFFYAASAAQWPDAVADGIDHWTKKLDTKYLDVLSPPRARVPISGGFYRAYHAPIIYRHAICVWWYVCGDPREIERLLTMVTHLGKKTVQGWGAVAEWRVEPASADYSVTGPTGELMRPVPDECGTLYGIRPPYWLPKHQIPCRLPTPAESGS